ncbi:MAG: UDP-glucose dehydrogenase family protein [Planctomycetota bacterium]|jgi:UDPglucose 6-dehydrogenase
MQIAVIGTGYVGLVVGTCFAETGNRVTCVDNDKTKIDTLERGDIPIYEPGLRELVARNVDEGRLFFSTDIATAVKDAVVCLIAVGTPPDGDGNADLKYVLGVAKEIGKAMHGYKVVVLKSTVPVGTNKKVRQAIAAITDHEFDVVSNPEFLKEGAAIDDFMKPDRVVIGAETEKAAGIMQELYSPFVRTGKPILLMDTASAEMTKYAANAMLATRISFMNEVARLCERVGADVNEVRKGIATDSRIGSPFLFAGAGYGGSCFPKDVRALVQTAAEFGLELEIIDAVESVNNTQKKLIYDKIEAHYKGDLAGKHLALWGLAFKPQTDDMREAPSLVIIDHLLKAGATVAAFDPEAKDEARRVLGDKVGDKVRLANSALDALEGADALVLITEWNEFRHVDPEEIKRRLKTPVLFDGRNILSPDRIRAVGFTYYGIGTK